jgi:hypothetical protein
MKKILIVLALVLASFANAQKGTYLVSGSVGFNSEKVNSSGNHGSQNNFTIVPKIGYQFAENWTAGVQTSASYSRGEIESGHGKSNYYSIGAFVRYSKPLSEIFDVYADLGSGYNFGNTSYTYNDNPTENKNKYNGFGVSIAPALLLKIKNGFGLNFGFGGLGYRYDKITFDTNSNNFQKTKSFDFTFGQFFTAGISKNF